MKDLDFQKNPSVKEKPLLKFKFLYNTKILLIILFFSGLLLRIYYTPFDLPLTQDALNYFWYANDVSILGELPKGYAVGNNSWPLFLSVFFSLSNSENFLDYMTIQRSISILFSSFTIPIVYLICKKFFNYQLSIVGAAIFAFEPRVIQNSILGITDPMYVFLGSISIFMILSAKREFLYLAFLFAGLATIVRVEGFFILLTISVLLFIRNKKKRKLIFKYLLCLVIFILIILPMSIIRTEAVGYDSLTSKILTTPNVIERESSSVGLLNWITDGMINLVKMLGWIMIPIFILVVPTGFFLIWKDKECSAFTITAIIIIMTIPALYAYSVKAFDTRYLLFLYPIFCVLALYPITKIYSKFSRKKLFLIGLIFVILVTSITFLEFHKQDYQHMKESYELASIVVDKTKIINQYIPESGFLPIVGLEKIEKFPILRDEFNDNEDMSFCLQPRDCKALVNIGDLSLNEFLETGEKIGLTHLIVDESEHFQYRSKILRDIFENEQNYPFLIKEFDSKENGFKYHVKIFRINFEEFNEFYKNGLDEN